MPGLEMGRLYGSNVDKLLNDYCEPLKESCSIWNTMSPRSPLNLQSSSIEALDLATDIGTYNSIEQLYYRVCSMQSCEQSQCRLIFLSDSEESTRTNSDSQHFVREVREVENSQLQMESNASGKTSPTNKISEERPPPTDHNSRKSHGRAVVPVKERRNFALVEVDLKNLIEDYSSKEKYLNDERYLGPRLVQKATDLVSSDNDPQKALELSILASFF